MSESASTSVAGSTRSVFTRTASGLVREMSLWDAALYGIFATGGVYAFVYLFPFPQALSPGVNVPLLIVLTLALGLLVYFAYAALGSAMPRAGGDYVYETRTIHRAIGFNFAWACQLVFWLTFPATGAYVVTTLGVVPILNAGGWHDAASWLLTPTGGFVMAVVVIVLCWLLNVMGMRVYRRVQGYVLIPLLVIGTATIIIVLLANLNANFADAFDTYPGGGGITVSAVHAAAAEAGFTQPEFSWFNTLIWVGVLGGIIPYTMFAAQGLLGEVKDASNLRRLFLAFLLPGVVVALVVLLLPWLLLEHIAGTAFLNEFATAYVNGAIAPPYAPNINIFAEMLAPGAAVVVLISLGFISGGFGIANVVFMNASRIMMAMSLDGLLPPVLSDVSKRFFTPIKSITFWSIAAVGFAAWLNYQPDVVLSVLSAGVVTAVLIMGVTCLGAALFAYSARDIYASAPAGRLRFAGIPLTTLLGAVAAVCIAFLCYWALTEPAIGLTTRTARIALAVAFASGVLLYIGFGFYRRAQGIDVSLRTREVPPE
ncbi:MAG TPA: APC family permease [Thermoleophilia bacterium]|nr:APC family permease [Thermoleophilia bacterium]